MMFDNPVLTTINSIIPLAFEFRSDNNSVELNWVLELRSKLNDEFCESYLIFYKMNSVFH